MFFRCVHMVTGFTQIMYIFQMALILSLVRLILSYLLPLVVVAQLSDCMYRKLHLSADRMIAGAARLSPKAAPLILSLYI